METLPGIDIKDLTNDPGGWDSLKYYIQEELPGPEELEAQE